MCVFNKECCSELFAAFKLDKFLSRCALYIAYIHSMEKRDGVDASISVRDTGAELANSRRYYARLQLSSSVINSNPIRALAVKRWKAQQQQQRLRGRKLLVR